MTPEDKTRKLFEFLEPIFQESFTGGKEHNIIVKIKRHQVAEVMHQTREAIGGNDECKIFVFRGKKIV